MKRRYWIRWGLQGMVILSLIVALQHYRTRSTVSGQAPELHGWLLDGTPTSLTEFRGQPLLLHFWSSWCPVCSMEQDSIDSISRDYAVLSVAMDDGSVDEIRQWVSNQGVSYRVMHDPSGRIARRFGVRAVPTSMILDAEGQIRFVEVGFTTQVGLRLRLWWVDR